MLGRLGIALATVLLVRPCTGLYSNCQPSSRRAALGWLGEAAGVAAVAGMVTAPDRAAAAAQLVDTDYPGTAVARMRAARERVGSLQASGALVNEDWEVLRRRLLWAGGLRDLPTARPGEGYTGHSFNDFNHCDLTCMLGQVQSEVSLDLMVMSLHSPRCRATWLCMTL